MNIVTIKDIRPTGIADIPVNGKPTKMHTYTFLFDDGGVEKTAVVGCKPEFAETVGKTLIRRLVPLKFDPPEEAEKKEPEAMGEAICGNNDL